MKLSAKSIEILTEIITGNSQTSPYRRGPQLIEFFHDFGERDVYGQGFPARATYTIEKLRKFNGTETMKSIVCSALNFWHETGFDPGTVARQFNKPLSRDGYPLLVEYGPGWTLYKALRGPLGLDPSAESNDSSLKPILDGFQKLIAGLYEVANKASDRYARSYNPAGRHAKLSVNAACALCEFLTDSYHYQQARVSHASSKEVSA